MSEPFGSPENSPIESLIDGHGRPLEDLRISVTDQCNFRCGYCMPKHIFDKNHIFLQPEALLTFDEIEKLVRVFLRLGIKKLRLTGGEPLLRKGLANLIGRLAKLKSEFSFEIALTTNGVLLSQQARTLKNAGLDRLTVSLDAMNPEVFQRMNDSAISIGRVLEGIAAAENAGFNAININVVVRKGQNEDQIAPIALHFKSTHHVPRFIEFMDVGNTNGWQIDQVIPSTEVRSIVQRFVAPLSRIGFSGVAERWAYDDGTGQVDFISSVTQAFCNTCTRLRLSADGQLFTCLFARHGHDIRASLRSKDSFASESNGGLEAQISNIWQHRTDRYSAQRLHQPQRLARVEMSYIGG